MRLIPSTRGGMLWRFLVGSLVVIAFTATAVAVAGLLKFKQFAADFSLTPAIKNANITIANPGNPQTLLLIGSDHRAGEPFSAANTDTMMLVRLDPNSSTINLLSVPRDLKVQIPTAGGYQTDKLNATYSIGGPNLLIRVLKSEVFPGLRVNHIIDVNFGGFEALVNAIGCVYTDVDRRYYNNTAYTDYSSIDIQPGYQRLCGSDALSFVRFRHTDSDLVRNARQQDFLRWAKSQFSESTLISQSDQLLKIFGQHTETDHDLHTTDGLINLFNLVAFSAAHTIKQIPFPAQFLPCGTQPGSAPGVQVVIPCYVAPTSQAALAQAFHEFMSPTQASAASSSSGQKGGAPTPRPGPPPRAAVMADLTDGHAQAAAIHTPALPVYFPRVIADGSQYCTNATCPIGPVADSYPRSYAIRDRNGHLHAAYRMTLAVNPVLGQYYGVQGTTWTAPPILNKPTMTRVVNGKSLELFFNGHKLSLAAWRAAGAVYWISNTLTDDLSNSQMIAIAASFTRAH